MDQRDYQEECYRLVREAAAKSEPFRKLVVQATGTGKGWQCRYFPDALGSRRGLLLAHRDELVAQLYAHATAVAGPWNVGIEAGSSHSSIAHPMVVGSVQTLGRTGTKRLKALGRDRFDWVIIDEVHHVVSTTYLNILEELGIIARDGKRIIKLDSEVKLLGLTATPSRGDGVGLHRVFDDIIYNMGLARAVNQGWLCEPMVTTCQTRVSLDGVPLRAGEFAPQELARRVTVEERSAAVFEAYQKVAPGTKALGFCVDVKHAQEMAHYFTKHGVTARWMAGANTDLVKHMSRDERARVMKWFRADPKAVGFNCALFTEGLDVPSLETVILAKPTKSATALCLDSKTEILTPSGWVSKVEVGDEVAAWKDGSIQWEQTTGVVFRPLEPKESMWGVALPGLNLRVTNKHRMIYQERRTRKYTLTDWMISEADSMPSKFRVPVAGLQEAEGLSLTDDEIRFIGLVMSDGTIGKSGGISIVQSERHPECIEYIEKVIEGCGFKSQKRLVARVGDETNLGIRRHDMWRWDLARGKPHGTQKHLRGWSVVEPYLDKALAPSWEGATRCQLGVLLEALNVGDGQKYKSPSVYWTPRTMAIATGRKLLADRLQSLLVRRGYRCKLGSNGLGVIVMHVSDKSTHTVMSGQGDPREKWRKMPSTSGEMVWCVSVQSGAIVTRRQGTVSIVGNCQMLGRSTRPLPGVVDGPETPALRRAAIAASLKPAANVIDVVDVCSKLGARALRVPDLFDAVDPERKLSRRKILQEVRVQRGELAAVVQAQFQDVSVVLRALDLFRSEAPPKYCQLRWAPYGKGHQLLLPKGEVLQVWRDELDLWHMKRYDTKRRGWAVHPERWESEREVLDVAESWAIDRHAKSTPLFLKGAHWRRSGVPPSRSQLDKCRSMGIALPTDEAGKVSGVSRGEVSDLMDRWFGRHRR